MSSQRFPDGFLWGCATSAHQIEGNTQNDWSEWEKSDARIATLKSQGKNPEDYISGAACESFIRDNQDLECLKTLGATAYRFSIEWSRLEPQPGVWNHEAWEQYRNFVKKLRDHNIEPFVSLWHWPVPLWVRDQGGWTARKTVADFAAFSERVVQGFGDQVRFYVTLNEPQVYASNSYYTGEWPPQQKSWRQTLRVVKNLIAGHKAAYTNIKAHQPQAQIGLASHNIHFEARPRLLVNNFMAWLASRYWNHHILRAVNHCQDFVGVNMYFNSQFHLGFGKRQADFVSDLNWDLRPDSLQAVLSELKRYRKPVYILEHGLADKDDKHRSWYLTESLKYVRRAIQNGVDVRGYFHWSLIDNFEWAMGFMPRFGLFEVDFKTFDRTPRLSVYTYKDIIASHGNNLE